MKKQLQKITLFSALILSVGMSAWGQSLFTQDTLTVCGPDSYDMVSPFPSNFNVWKKTGEEEVIVSSTMTFRSSGWYHLYTSSTGINDVSVCQVFNLANSYSASLNVPSGHQITSLQIGLWGNPNVNCVNPVAGSCNLNVASIINRSFLGKTNFIYHSGEFPDPCTGTQKYLYTKYTCSPYIKDSIYVNIIPYSANLNVNDIVSCDNSIQTINLSALTCDTTFQLIQTLTQSVNNTSQSTLSLDKGQLYRLKVTNTVTFGAGSSNQKDAAYTNYPAIPSANIFWRFNGYQPGPLQQFRPMPNAYTASHTYYFYFLADGTAQDIGAYDCCPGDNSGSLSISVEKVIINSNCGLHYLLNNVPISNSFQVSPSNQINRIYIADNNSTCLVDSFYVLPPIIGVINIGFDTSTFCTSNTILNAINPAADSYSWSTGDVTSNIIVSNSGEYSVTVTDTIGCSSSDTIYVSLIDPIITAGQTAFCLGDSTTLSINNVSNLCGNMAGSLQNGLVGWWPFCGNANDESGNGNNGTVNGATLTADRFGNFNSAYSFDGINDYIQVNNSNSLNPTEISINSWIYANQNDICILEKGNILNATEHSYSLTHNDIWQIQRGLKSSFSNGNCGTASNNTTWGNFADIPNNAWVMITVQINNNGLIKHYLNGQLIYSFSSGVPLSTCNSVSSTLRFGGPHWSSDPEWFKGQIDDIGIWNRALNQQEIEQLYNQGNLSTWWSDGTTNQTSIQVQPTQTTTFSVTVSDGVGSCTDSITIQVNNPQINAGSDISVCEGDSTTLTATGASTYAWDNGVVNGQSFVPNVEGYYNVTGTDTLGCSNSVSIFVDLLQPTTSNLQRIACDTYTAPDGNVYTNSGQYLAVIPNAVGCDSTIQLSLTINNSSSSTQTTTELDSYTWPVNGQTYTQSGVYTAVIPNSKGCDSTITLNLSLEFTGISEINGKEIVITPNPVDANFTLIADSKYIGSEYILTNQQGAIVAKGTIRSAKMEVNCSHLPKGTYLFQLNASDQHVIRVLKN